MGYHIILRHHLDAIECHYVEHIEELSNFPLREDSIVYQGEERWSPEILKSSKRYGNYAHDWHRAGIKAQILFKKQALKEGYILEELSNDQVTFKNYTGISKEYLKIKRGDFLVRNVKNIEIEVKCRNFYEIDEIKYFDFNCEDLERHRNMSKFTNSEIIIALYERKPGTDKPISTSLRTIEVSYMYKLVDELKLEQILRTNSKGEAYNVYRFPIKRTAPKFARIEKHKLEID